MCSATSDVCFGPKADIPAYDAIRSEMAVRAGAKTVELASELVIGTGALIVCFAMLWFGMPNKSGQNPPFLRSGPMQMFYPSIVLMFLVIGLAELLKAWFST
jgi:hypothetical protein